MATNTENIFTFIDTYASADKEGLYLESVIDACNAWLSGEQLPELSTTVTKEDIRRGIQLAVLKGMKQQVQSHHQMTPDAIGMLIGHFAAKLVQGEEVVTLLDPAAGTGNLLFTVMNSIGDGVVASSVEIDEILVRLAAVSADLMEQPVHFFVQDALRPLLIDPVDMVVCDLPVGYYPDDENAVNFEMMAEEGHAFSHHLFIEQSMNHLKEGGYGIYLIPATLFESDQAGILHKYLKKNAIVRAVIQLPDSLFKNAVHEKSILILQKPSEQIVGTPDVLLTKVPNLSSKQAMSAFLQRFDEWIDE
ncbi:class I SAM-dependent methyltransferase [Sporosarcina oncorhynchi]|uniref:Class I SAM-dependent methyltransferase n=1 Tax=Sporosarcina oncorhynchi TaxID=3056444 RepID=A0ABZ0L8T6_9BACL|nr:class I SAM-dependent methyltransferase [Sporosarcina sp. T2O-4]WOV88589.1 class I SAM-dependent methyltransferase [Sporosarcina sp. T2O-4]